MALSEVVDQLVAAMSEYRGWWALAGGWSIDTWLGEVTRDHHDIEVCILRRDAVDAWDFLVASGCQVFQIDPPGSGWRNWGRGDPVLAPSHQLKARRDGFVFDLFLEEAEEGDWVFRRHRDIVRPLEAVTWSAPDLSVVAIDVQLLYMAKSTEAKNEHDFRRAAPLLTGGTRSWLHNALTVAHPGHRWLTDL